MKDCLTLYYIVKNKCGQRQHREMHKKKECATIKDMSRILEKNKGLDVFFLVSSNSQRYISEALVYCGFCNCLQDVDRTVRVSKYLPYIMEKHRLEKYCFFACTTQEPL